MRPAALVTLLRLALFAAVFASAVLLVEYQNAGDPAFCGVGSGCMAVRLSAYSQVAGLPLPLIGLLAYGGLFALALYAREKEQHQFVAAVAVAGAAAACVLVAVQAFQIRAFCVWCVVVDSAAVVAAIAAVLLQHEVNQSPEAEARCAAIARRPTLVIAWAAGAAAAIGLPFLWAQYPVVPPLPPSIEALQVPGKITIVSFTDFECPHCRSMHPVIHELEEGGRVALVRKMMPLADVHPGAMPAAIAYYCVPEAKRDAMANLLYRMPEPLLTPQGTAAVAVQLGVDRKQMEQCVASPEAKARVDQDIALFDGLKAKALPLTFVGARVVMGAQPQKVREAVRLAQEGPRPGLPVRAMVAVVILLGAALGGLTLRADKA
jgi:uncharacterized membrane protein